MVRLDPYTADSVLSELKVRENLPLPMSPQSREIEADRDPFFSFPLRSDGKIQSLESRHLDWERSRAESWKEFLGELAVAV